MKIGAEVWKGRAVNYYNVKAKDIPHFLAADGCSIADLTYHIGAGEYVRCMVDYNVCKGSDGIDVIARQLNVEYVVAFQRINSRLDYTYYNPHYDERESERKAEARYCGDAATAECSSWEY